MFKRRVLQKAISLYPDDADTVVSGVTLVGFHPETRTPADTRVDPSPPVMIVRTPGERYAMRHPPAMDLPVSLDLIADNDRWRLLRRR